MNDLSNLELILMMICYGILNGTAAYCLKVGLSKVKDLEMTIQGFFRNPIRGFYQLLKVPAWVLGGVLFVSGFLIYQYALSQYNLGVVKPLSNLNLIVIFILGLKVLKEKFTKREMFGIAAMITGVILISMTVSEKITDLNLINMMIFSVIFIILSVIFINVTLIKRSRKIEEYFLTLTSGLLFSLGVIFNNAIYVYGTNLPGETSTLEFFLLNPFLYLLVISYFFAFFIGQVAYSRGRMVITAPIVGLLSLGLPILGAIFIFNEEFSIFQIIGITLIILSIIIIRPKIEPLVN